MPEEGGIASTMTGSPAESDPGATPEPKAINLFEPEAEGEPAPLSSAQAESESGSAEAPFEWDKVDFRRAKKEDIPEAHRPAFEHFQKQLKAVQGDRSREIEDLRTRENTVAAQLKELQELRQSLDPLIKQQGQKPTPAQAPTGSAERKIADYLNDPTTDAETRAAIKLMDQIAAEKLAAVESRYNELQEKVAPILEAYPQLQQAYVAITQKERAAHFEAFRSGVAEAVEAYGEDVNKYSAHILNAMGLNEQLQQVRQPLVNPTTQKPYTVKEAYELFSGKLAEKAAEMRLKDLQIKDGAKRKAAATPSANGGGGGELTEKEARSKIRELGFGGR